MSRTRYAYNPNQCEFCGLIAKDTMHKSKYYRNHNLVLCDRCVDKLNSAKNDRNIDEYWTNEYAIDNGFGSFPYEKVEKVANTWTIKS